MQGLNIGKLYPWKKVAVYVVGILITVALIGNFGITSVWGALQSIGITWVTVAVLAFFWFFVKTLAWQAVLAPSQLSFWGLFRVTLSGTTLDLMAPFALLGGNAIRNAMLQKSYGLAKTTQSLLDNRAISTVASTIFTVSGLALGLHFIPGEHSVFTCTVPSIVLAIALLGVFLIMRNDGFYGALIAPLRKSSLSKNISPATWAEVDQLDRHVLGSFAKNKGVFVQALILHLLGLFLMTAEVYVVGHVLDASFSQALAFVLVAVGCLVRAVVGCTIPRSFGVLEAVTALVASLFLPQGAFIGLVIILAGRVRGLVSILVGLAVTGNPFMVLMKK